MWTLSNILAGSKPQIQMVIDAQLVPPLVQALRQAEFRIQREAAWAVSNFTVGGTKEQVTLRYAWGCCLCGWDLGTNTYGMDSEAHFL